MVRIRYEVANGILVSISCVIGMVWDGTCADQGRLLVGVVFAR